MAKGINKAIIVGNLGADPENRFTAGGSAVANISVATSDQWKDKQSGERRERTEWHRVVFFGRLAEIVGEYLRKGSKVYIEGRIQTRKWQGQDGQDRYTTEIVANEMQMLDSRSDGAPSSRPQAGPQSGPQSRAQQGRPPQQQQPQAPVPQAPQQEYADTVGMDDDWDSDIPF